MLHSNALVECASSQLCRSCVPACIAQWLCAGAAGRRAHGRGSDCTARLAQGPGDTDVAPRTCTVHTSSYTVLISVCVVRSPVCAALRLGAGGCARTRPSLGQLRPRSRGTRTRAGTRERTGGGRCKTRRCSAVAHSAHVCLCHLPHA